MTSKSNYVAVVIVNYGTADLAIKAVESVLKTPPPGISTEVHLVDNASPGDDAERLVDAHLQRGWGPEVVLYLEKENHGFARGNNQVFKKLEKLAEPPEFVFLLNPDAELVNDAIGILINALKVDRMAGAAGAGISFPDGRSAVACFRFPTLLREIVWAINFGPIYRLLPSTKTLFPLAFNILPPHPLPTSLELLIVYGMHVCKLWGKSQKFTAAIP